MILPDIDMHESKIIAEKLRCAIAQVTLNTGHITASIGIATVTLFDSDTTLLQKAD